VTAQYFARLITGDAGLPQEGGCAHSEHRVNGVDRRRRFVMAKPGVVGALLPLLLSGIACSDDSNAMMGNPPSGGASGTPIGAAGDGASGGAAGSPVGVAGMSGGGAAGETGGASGTGGDAPVAGTGGGPAPGVDPSDPTTPLDMLPANCKGFEVLGITHSPGGDTLPNTCAPFHNIRNNPYAIRCIDADPGFDTGWPGDEWCILPPPPDLGTQIAVSPSSYTNPEPGFVLQPGQERTQNYYKNSDNAERRYFYRTNLRMRTGSHHIINSLIADRSDGWTNETDTGLGSRGFPGAQRADADRPQTLQIPPENAGHGDVLEARQQFQFNMHHFNFTQAPVLREVWVNIWWKPQSEVTEALGGIGIFGNPLDLNIPPGEHRELHYRCNVTGNTRIVTLNGHRHAHTDRFGVWIVRAGGATEQVYESFDYNDMPTYQYDSISDNPAPDLAMKRDGGSSGVLNVGPGDQLHFVCDVTNRTDPPRPLRFANEVLTGEMCILFGSRTGSPLCQSGTRVQ
jgi:hypothetical protein